jgi:prophage antirepressor-like protein
MTKKHIIQIFEDKKVRTVWDDELQKWFFSIVDVCEVLAESKDPAAYWRKLKQRLKAEGNETVTNCHALKMTAPDGKKRLTDVADMSQLFRLIQSIPSKKAEPFKNWMAEVAAKRIDQMQDPELNYEQGYEDYRRLGYSDRWINQRLKSIEVRKELTDEWDRAGVKEGQEYASLTDIITRGWSGKTTRQYKQYKGLKKESLRDNMTNIELALNTLAEASAAEISKAQNPKGFKQSAVVAKKGGEIAGDARKKLEKQIGRSVVTKEKASDYLPPADRWEALSEETDED